MSWQVSDIFVGVGLVALFIVCHKMAKRNVNRFYEEHNILTFPEVKVKDEDRVKPHKRGTNT